MKTCSSCKVSKPESGFYQGVRRVCIECRRADFRRYHQDHREQKNAANTAWNRANRDRVNELAKERYRRKVETL